MSKLAFKVRTIRSVTTSSGPPLTKDANSALQLAVAVSLLKATAFLGSEWRLQRR